MSSVHTLARQEDQGDESDSGEVHCSGQGQEKRKKVGASNKICRSPPTSSRISDGQPVYVHP